MEEKIFEGLKYLISYPDAFDEDKKYPLVICVQGHTRGMHVSLGEHIYGELDDPEGDEADYASQALERVMPHFALSNVAWANVVPKWNKRMTRVKLVVILPL